MIQGVGHDLKGTPVHQITLEGDGINAKILSYGAILQDLRIAGHETSLVLGHSELEPYLTDQNYLGAMVGRVANRIRDGVAVVGKTSYQLDQNLADGHHLHGGRAGTAQRVWRVLESSQTHVTLEDVLPDGHMGYPGRLTVQVRYSVQPAQTLMVEITAQSDAMTLCNFAHHSYFNLGGDQSIAGHGLTVAADRYLPVNQSGIPLGDVRDVADTEFDFRCGRQLRAGEEYDHNLCLAEQRRGLQHVARLSCPKGETHMDISTTEPGLQIYTGHGLKGEHGVGHSPFAGIALEPQGWPDAINQPKFPSVTLSAGETYRQRTAFRFSLAGRCFRG